MRSSVNSAAALAKQVTDGGDGAKCVSIVQQNLLTTSVLSVMYLYIDTYIHTYLNNSDFIFNCELLFFTLLYKKRGRYGG